MKNLEANGRSEYEFEFEGVLRKADFFGADYLPELLRVVESYAPRRTNYFLEWGSGLSTLLLADIVAQRGSHLVTIDTNRHYLAAITQAIRDPSVVTALAADLIGPRRNQHDPELNYATLPLSLDQDFDFILIDGRRRLECASSALLLTHPDSVIVLHDYRRARYQLVNSFFDTIEAGPHFLVMRPKRELSHVLESSRVETRRIFSSARQPLTRVTTDRGRVPEAKNNGTGKVVFGCVSDNNRKFLSRTLRLLRSIRWFGGTLADADIIACVVDNVEPDYADQFRRLGARVRVVPRFNPDNPFANKTQFFTLPELTEYETAILLDCDTVLVQDPSPFLRPGTFQAKIADLPTVPSEVLASLCEHFGLPVPASLYRTTFGQTATIWYCNSGVLVCPIALMGELVSAWRGYEMKLTLRPELLGRHQLHRGQAALALAFIAHQVPFQELPVSMNLPLHTNHLEPPLELLNADPVILHYHNLVDSTGYLLPSPYPQVQQRIQIFNERLREHEASSRDPSATPIEMVGETDDSGAVCGAASPICIAGMHRSGTSMVARLMHCCGVFLGPDDELNAPAFDNPEGFWENLQFVRLNEEIIAQFGGKWDAPPAFQARWEFSPELGFLRERAGELIEGFRRHKHWGWKDPRNSLTAPFWQQLIPDMKVVVCVRNPLEVTPSLFARGYSKGASPFELWLTYNRQLLSTVPPERRLVTHYQSYFQDPDAEVRRVLKWLDVQVSDEGITRACEHISAGLRHYRMTTSEMITAGVPDEVIDLYFRICAEAGPVYQRVLAREPVLEIEQTTGSLTPKDYAYKLQLMQMGARLAGSEQRLRSLESELHKHVEAITYLNTKLRSHDTDLAALRPVLRSLKALRSIRRRLRAMWKRKEP